MRLSTIELKLVCSCFSSLSTSGIKLSCSKSKHYIQKSMAVTLSQEWLLTKAYRYIFIPEDMTHMSDDDDYDFAGIIDWMSGWVIRIREWFSLPTFVVTNLHRLNRESNLKWDFLKNRVLTIFPFLEDFLKIFFYLFFICICSFL